MTATTASATGARRRNRTTRATALLIPAFLAGGLLTACGDDSGETVPAPKPGAADPAAPAESGATPAQPAGQEAGGEAAGASSSAGTEDGDNPAEGQQGDAGIPDDTPDEYADVMAAAKKAADERHLSKEGLRQYLTSDFGGGFSEDQANYAADNLKVDYNDAALAAARAYRDDMDMAPEEIKQQLTDKYGDQFTEEQAQYAIDNL